VKKELREFCQARSGDKGNVCDLSLFAPSREVYEVLRDQVTAERVREHFAGLVQGAVRRYEVPSVMALKFVLEEALGGGAASSLRIDQLGKAMGSALLRMQVDIPDELIPSLPSLRPPPPP
jgi:hypothetical protein